MERSVLHRLNVLVLLCSWILGLVLTETVLGRSTGGGLVFLSLFPTGLVVLVAFWYIDASTQRSPASERADQ